MKVRRPTALRPRRKSTARLPMVEVCEDRLLMAIFVVTNNADTGTGSLRDALTQANANSQGDLIQFNLPSDELTIRPQTPLPDFTATGTNLDATSQPGYSPGQPVVQISGQDLPTNTPGLVLKSSGNAIRGLVINQFAGAAGNGVQIEAGGNLVAGCFIGLNAAGSAAASNGGSGIYIDNVGTNTIGGTTVTARNVISGNLGHGIMMFAAGATRNVIQGNYVGTTADGKSIVGNSANGIIALTGTANTIGGTAPGAGNLVSGNNTGVLLQAAGTQSSMVQGNSIGTNAAGTASLGNTFDGLVILGSGSNTIGGAGSASTNVISGNGRAGILIQGPTSKSNLIRNNYIGVGANGTSALGNATEGIWNFGGVDNQIGSLKKADGNIIANNGALFNNDGVYVNGGSGLLIGSNSIYNNVGLGIHLSVGSNDDIDSPVISKAETAAGYMNITGTFNGGPNADYDIQFFNNKVNDGEGKTLLSVTPTADSLAIKTNSSGFATFNLRIRVDSGVVAVDDYLTSTATRKAIGDTSEFSAARKITAAPTTDLGVTIVPTASPVLLGTNVSYVLTVTNNGPNTSTGSTVTFDLDPTLTLVSVSQPYTQVGNTLTMNLGPIAPTQATQITIVATPTKTGTLNVSSILTAKEIDTDPGNDFASNSTTVLPSSDLGITVSVAPSSPVGGDLIYLISGTNAGPSVATNAAIDFTLPANSTFVSGELSVAGSVGSVIGGVVTSTISSVAVGASGNFTLKIIVRPNAVGTATAGIVIRSGIADANPSNNTRSPQVVVLPATDLSVRVTTAPNPILLNQPMVYTVTVHNDGPSAATGVRVTDLLDASLSNVVPSVGTYDSGTRIVTVIVPTIAVGGDYVFTITATPTISKQISNQAAVVNIVEIDTNTTNDVQLINNPVSPVDLSITGTPTPDPSAVGQPLTLTYTVTNAGPAPATGVIFTETLPASWTLVSTSPGGASVNGSTITLGIGDLGAGASKTITVVVTPTQSGPFNTTASVSSPETDTNPSNNSITLNDTVSPSDLAVVVSTSTSQAVLGDNTTFTVQVTNNGPAPATNVTLNDSLSGSFQVVSVISTQGTPVTSAGGVSLALATLNPGASVTLTIVIQSGAVGSVTSTAIVGGNQYDPIPSNNNSVKSVSYVNTPGILQLESGSYSVDENAGTLTVNVKRVKGTQGTVTIKYATADGSARAGVNYSSTSGSLTFDAGETSKSIVIPIIDDGILSGTLGFSLMLSEPTGGASLGGQATAAIAVVNTDIDQNPPKVESVQPLSSGKSIAGFAVSFNQSVMAAGAGNAANYELYVSGRDYGRPDMPIPIASVSYDINTFKTYVVPGILLPQNVHYKLVVNGDTAGGIENVWGTPLQGANIRGTDYVGYAALGTNLSYYDATGNLVTYKLTGGGTLTLNRSVTGDASLLQLNGIVGRARQTLSGSVKRAGASATGVTRIDSLTGIGAFGAVYVKMTTPPFYVTNISGFKATSIAGLLPKTPKPKQKVVVPKGPLKLHRV